MGNHIMPHRNLELKVPLHDPAAACEIATSLGASDFGESRQFDTYFAIERGRLKLREVERQGAELIFYQRPDEGPERWSDYSTAPVEDPAAMKALLTAALGVRGVVSKRRRVFLWNQCRIHVDEVEDLGSFLEFEIISTGYDADAQARMTALIQAFRVDIRQAVLGSYVDLPAR
jgi:adenylate cyclase, class 2